MWTDFKKMTDASLWGTKRPKECLLRFISLPLEKWNRLQPIAAKWCKPKIDWTTKACIKQQISTVYFLKGTQSQEYHCVILHELWECVNMVKGVTAAGFGGGEELFLQISEVQARVWGVRNLWGLANYMGRGWESWTEGACSMNEKKNSSTIHCSHVVWSE